MIGSGRRETDGFAAGVAEQLGYYVYLLIDPATGRPFYIGKGVEDRCFAHLHEARRTTADTKGDYPKLATIRAIEAAGAEVGIELLRHGLSEPEAYATPLPPGDRPPGGPWRKPARPGTKTLSAEMSRQM